jgi:putative MATE family efflux protein
MQDDQYNEVTQGPLLRAVISLSWPMLVAAVLQNMQSLIDLYWVGRLGSNAVAALALSGTTLMLLFPVIIGMSAGTVAMVSRRVGAGNSEEAAVVAGQSLGMALFLGLAVGVTGWLLTDKICILLGAPAEVLPLAKEYLNISFVGCFTIFLLFMGNSVLRAAGNSNIPMLMMIMASAFNIVLDPIMIFGLLGFPALGVRGAALATVLAQGIAALSVVIILGTGRFHIHVHWRSCRPQPALLLQFWRIGLPGTGQMLARSLMALVLMRLVAQSGASAIAAYGIGLRFHMITLMPAFAIGAAAATMVGQNLGAGQPLRAARAAWLATIIDVIIMVFLVSTLWILAPSLITLFSTVEEVIQTGTSFIRITAPFYIFVAFAIVLTRSLQGAGDTMTPMIITIISLWGLQVPLAIYLSNRMVPATQGIWWAMAAAITLHGILITGWFQTGRWKHKQA